MTQKNASGDRTTVSSVEDSAAACEGREARSHSPLASGRAGTSLSLLKEVIKCQKLKAFAAEGDFSGKSPLLSFLKSGLEKNFLKNS